MKKPVIFFAAIVAFTVIVLVIFLSGGDKVSIVGEYRLVDAAGDGNEMFKAQVTDMVLRIDADDTGSLSMLGQTTPVVINQEEKKISFNNGVGYTPYTLEGKKLTVERNGTKLVFKKK